MQESMVGDPAAAARAALVEAANAVEEARCKQAWLNWRNRPKPKQPTAEEEAAAKAKEEEYTRCWCADAAQREFESLPEDKRTGPIIEALVDLVLGMHLEDVDFACLEHRESRDDSAREELLDAAVSCAEAEAAQASVNTSALVEAAMDYGRFVLELRRLHGLSAENQQQR